MGAPRNSASVAEIFRLLRVKSGVKAKTGVDTGNFIYAKIEAKSRKTDPFMAFVASMTIESELGDGAPLEVPSVGAFVF